MFLLNQSGINTLIDLRSPDEVIPFSFIICNYRDQCNAFLFVSSGKMMNYYMEVFMNNLQIINLIQKSNHL